MKFITVEIVITGEEYEALETLTKAKNERCKYFENYSESENKYVLSSYAKIDASMMRIHANIIKEQIEKAKLENK